MDEKSDIDREVRQDAIWKGVRLLVPLFRGVFYINKILRFHVLRLLFARAYYKAMIASLGKGSNIDFGCRFYCSEMIWVGDDTAINPGCTIMAQGGVRIGSRVLIAHDVSIITASHSKARGERHNTIALPIHIDDDVWIGAKALILPGVRISRGAIVGAGAIVTKNVSENSIVAGNPARVIGTVGI